MINMIHMFKMIITMMMMMMRRRRRRIFMRKMKWRVKKVEDDVEKG